jgi:hypothetical protein
MVVSITKDFGSFKIFNDHLARSKPVIALASDRPGGVLVIDAPA